MRAARGMTLLILSGALLLGASVLGQGFLSTDEYAEWSEAQRAALALVLAEAEAQDFLAAYPDWTAYSYLEEGLWVVGFYQGDEWLGDARVNLAADEVIYLYLPRELSPEAYAMGREAVAQVVLADAEVLALLAQPLEWDYDIHYNKYDDKWTMVMWRGLESLAVQLWQEGERFIIEDIYDPEAWSAQEAQTHARDTAIAIAYGAEGLWEALAGVDDWLTYAEPQTEDTWTVEFYGEGRSVMVLVDINAEAVLDVTVSLP